MEGRGVLALELVRPYLDVAGFQRWLCQRVWGDQLQRLDRDLEAAAGLGLRACSAGVWPTTGAFGESAS